MFSTGSNTSAEPSGEAAVEFCRSVSRLGGIAAEQLVATITGEHHGDMLARKAREEDRREATRVRERLIEDARHLGQQLPCVRTGEHQLIVIGPEGACLSCRMGALIVRRLIEADREGLDRGR